ncbi:hypothetical protein pb186bvf_003741 [Paramecium bursaria]
MLHYKTIIINYINLRMEKNKIFYDDYIIQQTIKKCQINLSYQRNSQILIFTTIPFIKMYTILIVLKYLIHKGLKHHFVIRYSGLILLSAATALTANFNLFLATIPGVLTGIQIASVVGKRYYMKQFVTQIDLDEKLENMKIKFADGSSLEAPVKTNNLIEIKDIFEQSKDKVQQEINEQYSKSNYVLIFKNSMLPGIYRLMVSQDISIIDNTKLFKDVISGSDLKQYEYKQPSQTYQSGTETEEEIEQRLKDELNIK